MPRELPSLLRFQCLAGSEPFGSAWVMVTFPTHAKNPYHLMFGPADERGVVEVTDAELLGEARKEQALALMDYATFPKEWTGEIRVEIIDLARLERVREAIGIYGAVNYQPEIETRLSEYEVRLREVDDSSLSASLLPSD